jgi:hypothetical protein
LDIESQEDDYYKLLGIHGFWCIRSFFVLINESTGKLLRITESHGVYQTRLAETKLASFGTETKQIMNTEMSPAVEG